MGFLEFQAALDAIWSSVTQDAQKNVDSLHRQSDQAPSESELQAVYDENLRNARLFFMQCFKNHTAVLKKEDAKARNEVYTSLEEKYGAIIVTLRQKTAEEASLYANLVLKYKDEVSFLKALVVAQENMIAAVKHKCSSEKAGRLEAYIAELETEFDKKKKLVESKQYEITRVNKIVERKRAEGATIGERWMFKTQQALNDRQELENKLQQIQVELKEAEYQHQKDNRENQMEFVGYKESTQKELELLRILSNRRKDATGLLESEITNLKKGKEKPTGRIGENTMSPILFDWDSTTDERRRPEKAFRVDSLGISHGWTDYPEMCNTRSPRKPWVVHRQKKDPNASLRPKRLLPLAGRAHREQPKMSIVVPALDTSA